MHEGVAVLTHLDELASAQKLDVQLRAYLFHPPTVGWNYPFGKVVLTIALMSGQLRIDDRAALLDFLDLHLSDPTYRRMLQLGAVAYAPDAAVTRDLRRVAG